MVIPGSLEQLLPQLQPERLLDGDWAQRFAYEALVRMRLFTILKPFQPVLAGTYPLGIHIPGSDLDVNCFLPPTGELEEILIQFFSGYPHFHLRHSEKQGVPTLIARWQWGPLPVEIFAQPMDPLQQRAVRHLLVEALLLHQFPDIRARIRAYKQEGMSTEAAFCHVFGIEAEPYSFLYDVSFQPVDRIIEIFAAAVA